MTITKKPELIGSPNILTRDAHDLAHVKSVTAWALFFDGEGCGRIVANWSDNPNGSVCTATVAVWDGPLDGLPRTTGKAGGGGYCKLSAAVAEALDRVMIRPADSEPISGRGRRAVEKFFESYGYTVFQVIG